MDDYTEDRCPAGLWADDPTSCGGPVAVTVTDKYRHGIRGCEHHGARLLASIAHGSVYSEPAAIGAGVRVFKAARDLQPYPWRTAPMEQAACISEVTRG